MVKNNIIIDFSGEGILNGLIFMALYLQRHTQTPKGGKVGDGSNVLGIIIIM